MGREDGVRLPPPPGRGAGPGGLQLPKGCGHRGADGLASCPGLTSPHGPPAGADGGRRGGAAGAVPRVPAGAAGRAHQLAPGPVLRG